MESQSHQPQQEGAMKAAKRAAWAVVLTVSVSAHVGLLSAAQSQPASARQVLSPQEMEDFLLHARITHMETLGKGVTNSKRATLSNDKVTHDVHIQTIDVEQRVFRTQQITELNFKDSYRFNIAAYRLARLLGLDNVPM